MAGNQTLASMTAAAALSGPEILYGNQSAADVKISATQIKTFTSNAPSLVTPALGTPTSGVLSSCTGLPISSGVAGLGTGIAAWLGRTFSAPQVTVYTSGSGTYTTPSNVLYLTVEMVGGGGGGGGSGTGAGAGGNGGSTTFGSAFLTCNGGTGGGTVTSGFGTLGGDGGTATGGDVNIQGGRGGSENQGTFIIGSMGGVSYFGGSGPTPINSAAGIPAKANTGSGGSGAGSDAATGPGTGGGAGGYLRKLVASPSATYAYAVGTAGTAGTIGTSGQPGGAGGSGLIIVTAYFQ